MITTAFIVLGVFYLYASIKSLTSDAGADNVFWLFAVGVTSAALVALVALVNFT